MLHLLDKVKEENPEAGFGEVGKLLGKRWKTIGEKDKAKYDEMAAKDKDRYEKEKKAYDGKAGGDDDDNDD